MTTMEQLAEQADAAVRELKRVPSLDLVRAALNESGIRRARPAMHDSLDRLANAQETLRSTQAVEAAAKEAYDTALAEADWMLQDRFVVEGAKTWLVVAQAIGSPAPQPGNPTPESTEARRPMTAEQRRAWVAAQAAKQPAVTMVAAALSNAAAETAAARDSVEVARLRVSVCRHEVDAAVAELEALVVGIPR